MIDPLRDTFRRIFSQCYSGRICTDSIEICLDELTSYAKTHPAETASAISASMQGNRDLIGEIMTGIIEKAEKATNCTNELCLPCRTTRVMERDNPSDDELALMRSFLGQEIIESSQWLGKILEGTIASSKSSEDHKKKAKYAHTVTIPVLMLSVAVIADLQKTLAQTIEDRDKYHRLADMLMD